MKENPVHSFRILTLDGGAASGKSSTARGVALQLDYLHADTGSHYRALTHLLLDAGIPAESNDGLSRFLEELDLSSEIHDHGTRLVANGKTLHPRELRSDAVNAAVSLYAALPEVRDRLLRYQRWHAELARESGFSGLVMEGRDIGTVVFPDAYLRFFLEADADTRSRRRQEQGQNDSITDRDRADSGRKNAPLLCPPDAIRIDTGKYSLAEVIHQICERAR